MLGGEIFGRHTSLSRWRRIWETSLLANHSLKVRPLPQQLSIKVDSEKSKVSNQTEDSELKTLDLIYCRMVKFLADTPPCRGGEEIGKLLVIRITTS